MLDFMHNIKSYFRERLIGVVYTVQNPPDKARFELGSAFLLETELGFVLVTAGHVLHDIFARLNDGTLGSAALLFPYGPKSYEMLDLPEEVIKSGVYCDDEELDIGLFPCRTEILKTAYIAGIKAINRNDVLLNSDTKRGFRLVVGLLAEGSTTADRELFTYFEGGKEIARMETFLSSISVGMFQLVGAEIGDTFLIEDKPLNEDFGSVCGMSGGFVIELTPGTEVARYHWVGVQSSQKTSEWNGQKRLRSVKYVNSLAVLGLVDSFIRGVVGNEGSESTDLEQID